MSTGFEVTVDGETFGKDHVSVTVGGRTYTQDEMTKIGSVQWANYEAATLTVAKPGGLKPGVHEVAVAWGHRTSYIPGGISFGGRMLPEIHAPTLRKSTIVDDYVDFIQKEKTTPWFGLNIDFGVLQNLTSAGGRGGRPGGQPMKDGTYSKPEELVPLLPYVHCCHAKFNEITDACECTNTPYAEIVGILRKHNWNGYLLSEYEGADRNRGGGFTAVRKQHVMLKRLLGEA